MNGIEIREANKYYTWIYNIYKCIYGECSDKCCFYDKNKGVFEKPCLLFDKKSQYFGFAYCNGRRQCFERIGKDYDKLIQAVEYKSGVVARKYIYNCDKNELIKQLDKLKKQYDKIWENRNKYIKNVFK